MKLIPLTPQQITSVYNERMKKDFPADELRPLANIFQCMEKGIYEFLGFVDEESDDCLIGYVTFTVQDKHYLVDYLAIDAKMRSEGYGSELMHQLALYLQDADSIIGEVENPKYAKNPEAKELQKRRLQFYLRNGVRNTGVEVTCFGVPFLILEVGGCHSEDEIRSLYKMHYQKMLPKEMYEANIKV